MPKKVERTETEAALLRMAKKLARLAEEASPDLKVKLAEAEVKVRIAAYFASEQRAREQAGG